MIYDDAIGRIDMIDKREKGVVVKGGRGQTVLDVALESAGSAERAWELAEKNGRWVLDEAEGLELAEVRDGKEEAVVRRYRAAETRPATGLTERDGIGGWSVGGSGVVK